MNAEILNSGELTSPMATRATSAAMRSLVNGTPSLFRRNPLIRPRVPALRAQSTSPLISPQQAADLAPHLQRADGLGLPLPPSREPLFKEVRGMARGALPLPLGTLKFAAAPFLCLSLASALPSLTSPPRGARPPPSLSPWPPCLLSFSLSFYLSSSLPLLFHFAPGSPP